METARVVLAAALGLSCCLLVTGCAGAQPGAPDPNFPTNDIGGMTYIWDAKYPPSAEVSAPSCKATAAGISVSGTVTNPTTLSWTYAVYVEFMNAAGDSIDTEAALFKNALVKPAASASWTAHSSGPLPSGTVCAVSDIERIAP